MRDRELRVLGVVFQLYDTNLSYRFRICGKRTNGIQFNWWYDRGSRRRRWMPLELRVEYFDIKRMSVRRERRGSDGGTGLIGKYRLSKADGSPMDPNAKYFVLRPDNDLAARFALLMYADCIEGKNPQLAQGLRAWVSSLEAVGK